jgi:hypothetical protein
LPKRSLGMFDTETGEVIEEPGLVIWVPKKIKSPYGSEWMQINQEATALMAADEDLDGVDLKVFLYLYSRLDFENYIRVPQVEIAEALHKRQQHVSRSIKKLEKKGILIPAPKIGRSSIWRLNAKYGWKGKVINLKEHLDQAKLKTSDEAKRQTASQTLQVVRDEGKKRRDQAHAEKDAALLSQDELEAMGQQRLSL